MEFQRVHQQLLQSHHLFEPLSPVQLQELLASSDLVNLDKGAYVFRQGEPAHAFYYLISGCVKIYRLTPEGQEKILEVTNERNTFAEAMMFMDTPNYVATAQAVVPSQLFRFSNKAYLRQLQDNTPLALALLAKLSTRLHQRIDEIETLSLKNATHRVVRYLLTLAAHAPGENCRVEIPVAKQLVAGHLSIQPETFSRIMHRLSDEGIIRLDGREISILDRERLECFE
ncbi:transcriptional regulator Dnr [Pseudomonas aeruginosa]|uniref:transcriptional regulator Dnr n=1 Tax=Pseudomonas aeruginosa TaxID=287 RepID=UPI000FF2BDE7|nr:transcriptional regulator Dnr [Pseudomonas aeruginosa]RWY03033.1 Crp/Fnr family transcriptional regulator [Pseudomonas aeruginosa]HBN8245140.1 transcriptional regulator Dnr [Pseudomonas aeruginosa]HEB0637053.1 transcriptional regulator Dnr [Pseudomonas aeruginosa]HEB0648788.1 transcriptional regulator Dnr [Pseudomonas aeruginosa]